MRCSGGMCAACSDYSAVVSNCQTGSEVLTLRGHQDRVMALAFSPQDGQVVTGSYDGEIRLWDLSFALGGEAH